VTTAAESAQVDSGSTDEERRAFYQQRVAKAGLVGAALGGSYLLFRVLTGLAALYRDDIADAWPLTHPSMLYHLGGVLGLLAMWLICRRGSLGRRRVELVETAGVVASCAMYSLMGTHIPLAGAPELVVTLALTHGLYARAIFVPSTSRRTFVLGVLVGIPHLILVYRAWSHIPAHTMVLITEVFGRSDPGNVALFQTLGTGMWWVLTLAGTTAASHVIYGLRKEVRDVRRLGQYELLDKLGEGGMGVVYRARHAMLQRPTAVKLLPPDRVGEATLTRFEREVRLTAKLTHPNTITVFDYGRTLDGVFYYAMELLDDGATLSDIVEAGGPLPPSRVVHVLVQALGALAEAHAAGLIHRDIKPQNLMLCRRGGMDDVIKVLDFGLVKEMEDPSAVSVTGTNVIVGTPHFMAPEMLTRPGDVDGRSDLYALAAVAFFLLTGENVFEAATVVEICGHHLHSEPRRIAEVAGQDVPAALDDLILTCLAKKPEDRPESAAALRAALEALDIPAWTPEQAAAWWADHGDAVARAKQASSQGATGPSVLLPAPR